MQNTAAKDTSRELFYIFLQQNLTTEEIHESKALVLLGQDRLEIPFLDKLGIKRHNITCVEFDRKIYHDLHFWNLQQQTDNQGIGLYGGELTEYLRFLVEKEQLINIFNLDIYGSLHNHTLPQFRNVIKLSRQQRKVIVGTYLSAGRDADVLIAGIQASVWLMLFDRRFIKVIEDLVDCYVRAGYPAQVAFTHSFRIMQWVYEILKVLISAHYPRRKMIMHLGQIPHELWLNLFCDKENFTWGQLLEQVLAQKSFSQKISDLKLSCGPIELSFLAYPNPPWTQLCQFMMIEKRTSLTVGQVLENIICSLRRLHYINSKGELTVIDVDPAAMPYTQSLVLPPASAKKLKKQKEEKIVMSEALVTGNGAGRKYRRKPPGTYKPKAGHKKPAAKPKPSELWTKENGFSELGMELIFIASADKKATGRGIAKYFPKETPLLSIISHLAHSRRKRKLKAKTAS